MTDHTHNSRGSSGGQGAAEIATESGASEPDVLAAYRQPFETAGLTLTSRFVMAPMTRRFSPGGIPTAEVAAYYARRASSGIGLIISEGAYIDDVAAGEDKDVPRFHGHESLEGWSQVLHEVHAVGGRVFPQLWHLGPQRTRIPQPDRAADARVLSPSGVGVNGESFGEPMSIAEIDAVIASYARGARDAQALGFDGVEIHGAHGYMVDSFLWSFTNRRTDDYGGSPQSRAKFGVEVVRAMRSEAANLPISFRFSQWKVDNYDAQIAQAPDELEALLSPIANAGVTLFHPSTRRFWEPAFPGSALSLAGWTKKLTGRPTIVVGSIGLDSPLELGRDGAGSSLDRVGELNDRFANDEFDLVALGRALLADHDWTRRVTEGTARTFTTDLRAQLF